MTPPGPDTLDVLIRLAPLASAVAATLVVGIMAFGVHEMRRSNNQRAKDAAAAQAAASDDRKVTQGMLAALTELVRRTSPPPSQDGPPARPRRIAPARSPCGRSPSSPCWRPSRSRWALA